LAAPQGVEPRYAAPEAAVLPLNEGATRAFRAGSCRWLGSPGWRRAQLANLFIISGFAQWVKHRRLRKRSSFGPIFSLDGFPSSIWLTIQRRRIETRHPVLSGSTCFHRESRNHPGLKVETGGTQFLVPLLIARGVTLRGGLRGGGGRGCGSWQSIRLRWRERRCRRESSGLRSTPGGSRLQAS
jgi:hypothetical protein